MKTIPKLILSLTLCGAVTMQAETLLTYNFDGQAPTASSVDANLGATNIGFASTGFVYVNSDALGNPKPSILANASGSQLGSRTAAEALTNNDYIGFTVTPDTDYQMDLASFKIDAQAIYGATGVAGDVTEFSFGFYSSVDGFDNTGDQIGSTQTISYENPSTGANQGGFSTYTFNVASLSGLSTATEFRFYVWVSDLQGDITNYNNRRLTLDNVTLEGSVTPIPEPATVSLIIAGIAGIVVFLRRRYSLPAK